MPADSIKIKLVIAYDGANYAGWQTQRIGLGVQQKIEEALAHLIPGEHRLHSSSRTDTGVHAIGMVAHVEFPKALFRMTLSKLPLALNAHLPEDIRVYSARRVPAEFHARFDAAGKQYRYFVWNFHAANPLLRHSCWLVPKPLDLAKMRQAALALIGKHDFACFAAARPGAPKSTVRTLRRCELRRKGPLLTFIIEADGFLYKMCRGIVGTLVQVGLGKFDPADVLKMLAARDRRISGMNAPAHGLALWKVFYRKAKGEQPVAAGLAEAEEDE